jgi:hypothetical protein
VHSAWNAPRIVPTMLRVGRAGNSTHRIEQRGGPVADEPCTSRRLDGEKGGDSRLWQNLEPCAEEYCH